MTRQLNYFFLWLLMFLQQFQFVAAKVKNSNIYPSSMSLCGISIQKLKTRTVHAWRIRKWNKFASHSCLSNLSIIVRIDSCFFVTLRGRRRHKRYLFNDFSKGPTFAQFFDEFTNFFRETSPTVHCSWTQFATIYFSAATISRMSSYRL